MREVIEDIRKLLKIGAFVDEQHVRFSLVGRICLSLGWNIWNPAEFNTEYKVEKLPSQILPVGSNGRVDIALFLSENNPKAAEVFMEIKAPGKLIPSLKDCEDQLHAYTGYHRIAIGILTDGIVWRFYVPAVGGYFKDTLFAQFNLLTDNIDHLLGFFNDILRKDRFHKLAIDKAETMLEELSRISMIQDVKHQASQYSYDLGGSEHVFAQQLINRKYGIDISIEDIHRLWDRSVPDTTPDTQDKVYRSNARSAQSRMKEFSSDGDSTLTDSVSVIINTKGVTARGLFNPKSGQLTISRGSEIVKNHMVSFDGGHLRRKQDLIKSGQLYLDPTMTKYLVKEDIVFKSPSGAARLVLGRSSNGFTDWYDTKGNQLEKHRR